MMVWIIKISSSNFTYSHYLVEILIPTNQIVTNHHIVLHVIKHLHRMSWFFDFVIIYFFLKSISDSFLITKLFIVKTANFAPFID